MAVLAAPSETLPVAAVLGPAPVVRNAKGQKRRPDGKACEALDDLGQPCGSFFSSTWYAQNRCCAKAGCKRYFKVAGTYEPKLKGILKHAAPALADRTNLQAAAPPAPPPLVQQPPRVQQPPVDYSVEYEAGWLPPGLGDLGPGGAIRLLQARFGSGCFEHKEADDVAAAARPTRPSFAQRCRPSYCRTSSPWRRSSSSSTS